MYPMDDLLKDLDGNIQAMGIEQKLLFDEYQELKRKASEVYRRYIEISKTHAYLQALRIERDEAEALENRIVGE